MVHQAQLERSRKRDRKTAGLPYGPNPVGGHLGLTAGSQTEICTPPKIISFNMFDTYQPWVLQTYGDQAKTKTITRNKFQRILQYLRGDYIDNENSKFKMWVKGRGFRIGPPSGYYQHSTLTEGELSVGPGIDYNPDKDPSPDIYVQTGTIKDSEGNDRICFKKVAIVEDFFDIIYNLHVCKEGKEHKHMGQKRTYRAVSERYAFVPREAVTKFLVLCTECPRRSSGVSASLKNAMTNSQTTTSSSNYGPFAPNPLLFSKPITDTSKTPLTPVKKTKGKSNFSVVALVGSSCDTGSLSSPPAAIHVSKNGTVTMPQPDADVKLSTAIFAPLSSPYVFDSLPTTPPSSMKLRSPSKPVKREHPSNTWTPEANQSKPRVPILNLGTDRIKKEETFDYNKEISAISSQVDYSLPITTLYMNHVKKLKAEQSVRYGLNNNLCKENNSMGESDGASDDDLKSSGPPEKRPDQRTDWNAFQPSSPKHNQDQSSQGLNKTDKRSPSPSVPSVGNESNADETCSNGNKDEEDDEVEDENDDDKIDAQYDPERLKAFNMFVRLFVDENLDRIVPISKQPKEKIQAIIDACSRQFPEFSDRTRKRIRTYLKSCRRNKRTREPGVWENTRPTPPHLTSIQAEQILATACDNESENAKRMRRGLDPLSQPNPLVPQPTITTAQASERSSTIFETTEPAVTTNGTKNIDRTLVNGSTLYQAGFPSFPKTSPPMLPTTVVDSVSPGTTGGTCQVLTNGPTDLSLKGSVTKGMPRPSLNPVEIAAVRQLIHGYRESASFLLRSADELENLLTQKTNT